MKTDKRSVLNFLFMVTASVICSAQLSMSNPQAIINVPINFQPQKIAQPLQLKQSFKNQSVFDYNLQLHQTTPSLITRPAVLLDHQISDQNDRLSSLYENVVITYTMLDNYALKYKFQNLALYEAGKNSIFSQVENPFACNTQF